LPGSFVIFVCFVRSVIARRKARRRVFVSSARRFRRRRRAEGAV